MFSNTLLIDFIKLFDKYDSIEAILKKCKDKSEKGFVYECLWNLVFKFGCHPLFPNKDYNHLSGNINNGIPKIISSLKNYVNKNYVISGNSEGYSDITIQNKHTKQYYFFTCKYFEKEKDIINYGTNDIISTITNDDNKSIYKEFDIYVLVKNKNKLLEKVKNANDSSKCIKKYMTEDKIFDELDLEKYYQKLKSKLAKTDINSYDITFLNNKDVLQFPFHQRLFEKRTANLISKGEKKILWGAKPRSGKTYMTGLLIISQCELYDKYNALIITPAPTETSPQFTDELFKKYSEFDNFNVIHLKSSKDIKNLKLEKNNIIVISKQLLQSYINDDTIKDIKNLKLNVIIFDENHFGGTSDLSEEIINSYESKNTVKLFLTATYNKSLRKWKIPFECQIFWDIEDEQFCKTQNIDGLIDKHGDMVKVVLDEFKKEGYINKEVLIEYEKYPDLHILTTMFDSQRWDIIKDDIMDSKYGFSMETLFALSKGKKKELLYPNQIKKVLEFISGNNKEKNFKNGDLSFFGRINKLVSETNSRQPFTQLWFLPVNGINDISENLKKLMLEDDILKNYDIYIVNSKSNELVDDVKAEINKREIKAKDDKKNGLIILAGNMLTLGITLSLCDIVFLLNDTLSSDKVMQMMYRSMTESKNNDKKCGFVIDMKISRVLQACLSYNIHKKIQNTEDKIKFLIEHHLINIDSDYLIGKKINSDKIITKLLDIWKSDPINNLSILLKQIEDDVVEMDNADQKALNNYFTKSLNGDNFDVNVELKDEDDDKQSIKDGKEIIKDESNDETNSESEKSDEDDKEEIKISFTKDVLPFVIPFACLLTLKDNNNDFVKMLDTIGKNKELLEIFDEQSYIWWNNKGILELIKKLTEKYVEKNSNTFNIGIIMKTTLKSLIDKPKELLEFIAERLKPKETEKKKFGEVFTPMKLVFEMIDKLDEYYKKNNGGKGIFSNKNLKWFDPCVGMGNFMIAVYLRLMEGLKTVIIDDDERKKHILENMLYMSELNKKNVLICKEIFDINNEYKLNIYNGDSLKLDTKKEWNIENFDVIVGNPPYNASGTKATGNTIWQIFVNNSINILQNNGYITFIHPNGWRKPNTENGKFYGLFEKITKKNTLLYLEIHDTKDGMKQFNCGTRYDWYILQKMKNKNNKTKIIDQNNISYDINLNKYNWLANCELDLIDKLVANDNEEKCKILQSMSAYEPRKKWISKIETKEFKYQVVHSTPKDGHRFVWSSRNDNGHYGIKKVIFGESGIYNPIIDIEGKYAMSQGAMAIVIDNLKEGEKLSKFLCSSVFNKIIKACLWSSFRIEWGMFKDFKKNFYEILNSIQIDEGKEPKKIVKSISIKNELANEIKEYIKPKKIVKSVIKAESSDEKPKKKQKPIKKEDSSESSSEEEVITKKPAPKKPTKKIIEKEDSSETSSEEVITKKPAPKKPTKKVIKKEDSSESSSEDEVITKKPAPKKPTKKVIKKEDSSESSSEDEVITKKPAPKKPTKKVIKKEDSSETSSEEEVITKKPAPKKPTKKVIKKED